jgi:PAS domain S-box-containing protein
MFVAWIGGTGPGLLALVLTVVAFDYFFLSPVHSFSLPFGDLPRLVLFIIAALFVLALSAAQRRTAETLRRIRDEQQETVRELQRLNEALRLENAERKRAEEKIRLAEQELQATVDTIPALAARYRPDGSLDFVNQTWRNYTGLAQESLKGQRWGVAIHPDDLLHVERAWRAHLATGDPFDVEQRLRRANGEYRWHWVRRVPLRDENGNVVKWYGVGFDIEDQKRAEDALRQSEAALAKNKRELELTIDMIAAVVTCSGPDGERDFVNRPWRDYTGLTLADIQGERWRSVVHPDDCAESEVKWRASLSTGEPFEFEQRLRRADGEFRWHMVRRVPLRDDNGTVVRWYGIGHDVEDQKRAETALRRSEAHLAEVQRELQLTIDTIPALVAVFRRDGEREFVNQTWRDYTGFQLKDIQNGGWRAVVHPDDHAGSDKAWRDAVATGEPLQLEHRIRRADGEFRWHMGRRVPLRDEAGNILRWYGVGTDIEDQKRAEDAARRSEAQLADAKRELQATIDTIPTLVSSYWPNWQRDFVNQAWQRFTGISHPDDIASGESKWRRSLATGEPLRIELRFRRADGEYRWHMVDRVALRNENGDVVRWYSVGYDIEEQKRAESALRQSEAQSAEAERELRLTLDRIPTLAWHARADGSAEYLNKRWLDYTGLSMEQARGWEWQAAIHPEDVPGLIDTWRDMLASEKAVEVEARMRRFDGEYRWFLFRPEPLRDRHGKVVRWYGTNTDIEDRKRAEVALQRSEAYLAEAQRLSSTGSFGWVVASDDMFWSEETYQIMGVDRAAKLSIDIIIDRVHPDDRARVQREFVRMTKGTESYDYEHRLLLPDGRVKHLLVRAHHVKYASGKEEIVGAVMDVTEARKAQEALHAAQAELAHASRVMVLGEMSAWIAHEVNQPLAAIVSNGEACLRWLGRKTPDLAEVRGAVDWIIKDGNRASEVIRRVRALSNKAETQKAPLDINDIVKEVVALLQRELAVHRVQLRIELAPALPLVLADRVQLQQVIINLIMNGIEAMQPVEDRPRDLLIGSYQDDAHQVVVAVKDSGVGIVAESADRLFNAFFSTKPGGLGMGLSICRSIIEIHGGQLLAMGHSGPGATFQFALPPQRENTA